MKRAAQKFLILTSSIFLLSTTMTACVNETDDKSSAVSGSLNITSSDLMITDSASSVSESVVSDAQQSSYADNSNSSSALSQNSDQYQSILDELDELESIINDLEDLTLDDLEIPEP